MAGWHVALTEVTVEPGVVTVMLKGSDFFDESCFDVAVMMTGPVVAGAVKRPVVEIVPADADQLTAALKLPVPCTRAEHWSVWPAVTVGLMQVTVTEVMVGGGSGSDPLLQATKSVSIETNQPRAIK